MSLNFDEGNVYIPKDKKAVLFDGTTFESLVVQYIESVSGTSESYLNGGASLTIKGRGFTEGSTVNIDGSNCKVDSWA